MTSRRDRIFVALTFLLYAAVTLAVTLRHEPWCDEADSWLLMRDGGVSTMLARTGYAGTPALWYLLIAPFARLGFPYVAQQLLNLALAWGAALLFLIFAPFPRVLKVAFLFSYYMSFEYSVLARPYALMVLLLFAICAMWDRPWVVAVLLALLANTTSHGIIFAGLLLLCGGKPPHSFERWLATALPLIGIALGIYQLRVPADGPRVIRHIDPQAIPYAIGSAFLPGFDLHWSSALGVAVLICVIVAIYRDARAMLLFVLGTAALLILFVFVWLGGLRHTGLILILAIIALWLAKRDARGAVVAHAALVVTLLCSIVPVAQTWAADWRDAYSGGKEMAQFITSHSLERFEIAVHPPNETKSVFAFVPGKRFWFPATGRYGTYSTWDRRFDQEQSTPLETAIDHAVSQLHGKPWLLLTNATLPSRFSSDFRLLFANRGAIIGRSTERFYLYESSDRLRARGQ